MPSISSRMKRPRFFDRAAVLVGALVGEARVEVGEQVAHEARHLGAVEAGTDRALCGLGVLADAVADLVLRHHLGRAEVRQRLRHVGGLDAVAQVDAAVAPGVQDLLDRHRALRLDVGGDALELRQELVVEDRHLPEVGLALAERVGIGALVGDDAAAGARDDLHARDLALGDEAVARVVVRHAAGAVLDAVLDLEAAEAAGLEQVRELGFTGFHVVSSGVGWDRMQADPGTAAPDSGWNRGKRCCCGGLGGTRRMGPALRGGWRIACARLLRQLRGNRLAQLALEHLADQAGRQPVHDLQPLGQLEAGNALLLQEGDQLVEAQRRAGVGDHAGAGAFAEHRVGHGHQRSLDCTAGCRKIRFSTSSQEIFSPPRLIMSLRRPSAQTYRPRLRTTSPMR
jgi:hypothetical protein